MGNLMFIKLFGLGSTQESIIIEIMIIVCPPREQYFTYFLFLLKNSFLSNLFFNLFSCLDKIRQHQLLSVQSPIRATELLM